jgi:hypothetical protein
MPSIALIAELADNPGAGEVSAHSATMGVAWCGYLESHIRRVYGLVEDRTVGACNLLDRLATLPCPFETGDFSRKGWSGLTTAQDRHNALSILCTNGYLRPEEVTTKGRPKIVYHVHPDYRAGKLS